MAKTTLCVEAVAIKPEPTIRRIDSGSITVAILTRISLKVDARQIISIKKRQILAEIPGVHRPWVIFHFVFQTKEIGGNM